MQFFVHALDGKDEDALNRRLAVREQHMLLAEKLYKEGTVLYGAALLDDDGQMIGSTMIVEFPSRAELDLWLKDEPYVTGNVWQSIDIQPCRVAPIFSHLVPQLRK